MPCAVLRAGEGSSYVTLTTDLRVDMIIPVSQVGTPSARTVERWAVAVTAGNSMGGRVLTAGLDLGTFHVRAVE